MSLGRPWSIVVPVVAFLVVWIVLSLKIAVLLALVAGGVALYRRRSATPTGTPSFPQPPAAAAAVAAPTAAPGTTPTDGAVAPVASVPAEAFASADALIGAIQADTIAAGFFSEHRVKARTSKGTRQVAMHARARTGRRLYVEVTALQTSYGLRLDCTYGEEDMSLGGALALRAMGRTVQSSVLAASRSAVRKQVPELELEVDAYRRAVLDKYLRALG